MNIHFQSEFSLSKCLNTLSNPFRQNLIITKVFFIPNDSMGESVQNSGLGKPFLLEKCHNIPKVPVITAP